MRMDVLDRLPGHAGIRIKPEAIGKAPVKRWRPAALYKTQGVDPMPQDFYAGGFCRLGDAGGRDRVGLQIGKIGDKVLWHARMAQGGLRTSHSRIGQIAQILGKTSSTDDASVTRHDYDMVR